MKLVRGLIATCNNILWTENGRRREGAFGADDGQRVAFLAPRWSWGLLWVGSGPSVLSGTCKIPKL